jgi:glutathione S-transferase
MKLFLSFTSPYARKARIVLREHSLESRVEEVATDYRQRPSDLLAANPTGKIPALVTPFGALFDSPVICEYLDSLGARSLFPEGPALWLDKTRVALGDALMDASVALLLELRRDSQEQSAGFIERERNRIRHCLAECTPGATARPTMGDVSIASALAYLDLRHPDLDWRSLAPQLKPWHDELETRASFVATRLG